MYSGTSYRNYNFLPLYKLKLYGFSDLLNDQDLTPYLLILHSQLIFGQQPGEEVERKYVDAVVCPLFRPVGIDHYPALQALIRGFGQ